MKIAFNKSKMLTFVNRGLWIMSDLTIIGVLFKAIFSKFLIRERSQITSSSSGGGGLKTLHFR